MNVRLEPELQYDVAQRCLDIKRTRRYFIQDAAADALRIWLVETGLSESDQALISQIRKALVDAPGDSAMREVLAGTVREYAAQTGDSGAVADSSHAAKGDRPPRSKAGRKSR